MSIQRHIRTASRFGPQTGLSVRLRRAWFAEEKTDTGQGQAGAAGTSSAGTQNTGEQPEQPKTVPYERFAETIAKMREYEAAAQKLADEKKKRDEADALARGEHEKVIADLRPKADRADQLETLLKEHLETELANVPENMKFLFSQGDVAERLRLIDEAKKNGIIGKPAAPQTDAGATGGTGKTATASLTAEELQTAAKMRMTAEQYAKYKEKDTTS